MELDAVMFGYLGDNHPRAYGGQVHNQGHDNPVLVGDCSECSHISGAKTLMIAWKKLMSSSPKYQCEAWD